MIEDNLVPFVDLERDLVPKPVDCQGSHLRIWRTNSTGGVGSEVARVRFRRSGAPLSRSSILLFARV